MWTRREECRDIIKEAWTGRVRADNASDIVAGLKRCADDLSKWNRTVFGHVPRQIQKKRNVLNDLVLRDQNGRNGREINKIRKEINELLDCEEVMWQQRSKVQWMGLGDCNTKYFHSKASGRKKKNTITKLLDELGVWRESILGMAEVAVSYFEKLYITSHPDRIQVVIDTMESKVRWKVDLVESLFLPFEARTILNIPISYNLPEDKIIWVGNNRGVFSIKSAYYVALNLVESSEEGECSYKDPREFLWRNLWHLHIPSKIKIFAWRACVDALPTMVNLQNRGIGISDLCPCCGVESETLFHSIINCEVARRVWDNWKVNSVEIWQALVDISYVTLDILRNGTNRDLEVFFGVAWAVWYNRNQVAFESKCQMPDQVWRFARSFLQDYKGALVALNMNPAEKNNGWTPPPLGVVKINVDGATSKDGRNSSVGVVIRDSCGVVIAACGKFLQGQSSVTEVEALAVESGILLARDINLTQIIVEFDAISIVNSINENFMEGSIGHLFQGILALLSSFSSWKVNHVKRDNNRAAHKLTLFRVPCLSATDNASMVIVLELFYLKGDLSNSPIKALIICIVLSITVIRPVTRKTYHKKSCSPDMIRESKKMEGEEVKNKRHTGESDVHVWIPHERTGIYCPKGQEKVIDDVPAVAGKDFQVNWFS
ncbi:hypothetical protein SO802_010125 [Lithocarpus litseifolius]|uniref:RNase H type-1 domain-containing protein n=1 Tax=Lithocarpus litseifolius TaxID=425828 RepID=A0AAW2DG10_9ROSI